MKLFISADIEGTCGICDWQETNIGTPYTDFFITQMTKEVAAVCRAALNNGFSEVVVKDAHDSARNLIPNLLPRGTKLIRGWSGDPLVMMSGIDSSFDAAAFTGCHSKAGSGGNPLSHTMSTKMFLVKINGEPVSEFDINSMTASYFGVPSVMLTGDEELCEKAKNDLPYIKTAALSRGFGGASFSLNPDDAVALIEEKANEAFSDFKANKVRESVKKLPQQFFAELTYKDHVAAYRKSFYPGAKLSSDPKTVEFRTDDFYELLRCFLFLL
ncbi:MAG: M55 family metallopeptidase [Eubacteriales bacterium]|nr:M55 family metallopeptidase [Eubacteriales bacterium]MDD4474824.1 M55 family metallopeptidase [Eubacteriales bacterium]